MKKAFEIIFTIHLHFICNPVPLKPIITPRAPGRLSLFRYVGVV